MNDAKGIPQVCYDPAEPCAELQHTVEWRQGPRGRADYVLAVVQCNLCQGWILCECLRDGYRATRTGRAQVRSHFALNHHCELAAAMTEEP